MINDSLGNGLQCKLAPDPLRHSRETRNVVGTFLGTHWILARALLGRNDGQTADINQTEWPFAGAPNLRKHLWQIPNLAILVGSLAQSFTPL